MSQISAVTRAMTWRTPAVIILCGCLISLLGFGPRSAFGLFLTPMTAANGWGRDVFALAFALQNLLWGIGQPFAGAVADRFGMVRVMSVGALMYAAGLALMAYTTSPVTLQVTAGVLIGFGLSGCSFNLVIAAFGKILPERYRMLAIATPPSAAKADSQVAEKQSLGAALAEAFAHRSYVFLVLGFFTCGFQLAFITLHLPSYLIDRGLSAQLGGWTLATIGLFNIIGSISVGWLSTRYPRRYLLALNYFLRAVFIAAFVLLPASPVTTLLFAAGMGLMSVSTVPPTSGLVSLMFGTRWLATLYGFAFFSHQVGGFLGALLGGVVFEKFGSYTPIWWLSVLFGVLSALINLPIVEAPVVRPVAQPA